MRPTFYLLCSLLAGLMQPPAWSATVADMQSAGQLEISAQLFPAQDIVPGQRVELVITIATNGWFTGGTRLEIPEVAGLVILQTDSFASNFSENRNGHSWVIQRWTLDVFPQRAGRFAIPPVRVKLKVSGGNGNGIEGELYSPEVSFRAELPGSLERAKHWVAAPQFSVSQHFDRELEKLQVGDAFQREIVFRASDVLAMMLPTFAPEKLSGLAAYPEPSQLSNKSNRGDTVAQRVERITYIVETVGEYQLPARDYFWWDTGAGELQMRFLPAVKIHVGATSGDTSTEPTTAALAEIDLPRLLLWLTLVLLLAGVSWQLFKPGRHLQLARFVDPVKKAVLRLNAMRKPALPEALNPDSSAGE